MTNQIVKSKDGQIEITVRPGLVQDEIAASSIARSVGSTFPDGTEGYFNIFGYLCSQTVSSVGLNFNPESVRDSVKTARLAYDEFLKLPKALRKTWNDACEAADQVSDYALGPEPLPSNAPKNS